MEKINNENYKKWGKASHEASKKKTNSELLGKMEKIFGFRIKDIKEDQMYLSNMKFRSKIVDSLLKVASDEMALIKKKFRDKVVKTILEST